MTTTPPLIGIKTEHIRTGLHARPRCIKHARWYCSIRSECSEGEDSLRPQKGTRGHNPTCGRVITHGRVGTGRYGRNGRYGSPSTPGRREKRDNVDRSTRAGRDTPAPLPRLSNHPSDSGHTRGDSGGKLRKVEILDFIKKLNNGDNGRSRGDGRADILPYRRISPHGNKAPSPHLSKCYGFLTQPLPQGTLRRGKITCKNVNIF